MKDFYIDTDIGFDEAQKYHGRVPTEDEINILFASFSSFYDSELKFTKNGVRGFFGNVFTEGNSAYYWLHKPEWGAGVAEGFNSSGLSNSDRAEGWAVRCIKD